MIRRAKGAAVLMALALMSVSLACRSTPSKAESNNDKENSKMGIHYLEIVSNDAEILIGLYERMHGLSFGAPDADLGQARVATQADGTLIGVRKPLAEHEQPIVRTYVAVDDIQRAVKQAEANGALIAYGPTQQGQRGTFAIVIQGDVQHGLWQR